MTKKQNSKDTSNKTGKGQDLMSKKTENNASDNKELVKKNPLSSLKKAVSFKKSTGKKQQMPTSYYSHFLSRAILLEEAGPPRTISVSIIIICAFVVGSVIWAAVTPLNETSIAQGSIIPASSIQPVQHLEGGIIAEILVENGQIVRKGDIIVRMAPTASKSELNRAKARHAALDMQIIRLKSFALNTKADFTKYNDNYSILVQDQKDILEQQIKTKRAQSFVVKAQITEKYNEMVILNKQVETQKKAVTYTQELLDIRNDLQKKGLGSMLHLLQAKREFNTALGKLQETQARKASVRAQIKRSEGDLIELKAKLRNDAYTQIGELSKEVSQVQEELKRLEDKVNRLDVISPTDGTVKGLNYKSVGAVVAPGDLVAEIVPVNGVLMAEVQISPRDIGHIKMDSEVIIKIDTYNFSRYGGIVGKIHHISASSYMNEKGDTYFKGTIELPVNYLGSNPQNNRITPGMTVVADIKTGQKTLLQYLVKPINNALDTSFRER